MSVSGTISMTGYKDLYDANAIKHIDVDREPREYRHLKLWKNLMIIYQEHSHVSSCCTL